MFCTILTCYSYSSFSSAIVLYLFYFYFFFASQHLFSLLFFSGAFTPPLAFCDHDAGHSEGQGGWLEKKNKAKQNETLFLKCETIIYLFMVPFPYRL